MSSNDLMISKYPYLSTSPNLFDYFLILGYDQTEINNDVARLIETNTHNQKISVFKTVSTSTTNFFSIHTPPGNPEVINSITPTRERKNMLDEDMITKLAFPEPPSVYFYVVDSNAKETYTPNQYSVIFMLNSDSPDGGKNTINGYNYIFYEMKERKVEVKSTGKDSYGNPTQILDVKQVRIFIPKAFCFLSQYPFYSQFSKLAQKLLTFFIKTEYSSIPIEILLFNIINFSPSPLKSKIYLSPFPEQLDNKPSGDPDSGLTLHQLSGYPIFDFNFSEIFSILPIETIADILIFNQLEIDMLFFSKNIEVLNIVMYIIVSLNYPLTDSLYLYLINSVSKNEFEDNCNTIYMGKPNTSMLGVNCSYTNQFDVYAFSKAPFIADLDNKIFTFKDKDNGENYDENSDEKKTVNLIRFIHDIISLKKTINNSHFEKSLIVLMNELEAKAKKIIHLNANQNNQIVPRFLTGDNSTYATNKMIQELFFEFNLNILYLFYQFITVKEDRTKKNAKNIFSLDIKQSKKKILLSPEEETIYDLISNGSKIGIFLENFIKAHEALDVYRIPLIFTEEFLYIKAAGRSEEKFKMSTFEIMDKFYSVSPKESNAEHLNFNSFFDYYNKELKEEYTNYMKESPMLTSTKITNSKHAYQYKGVELDNNILFKYMYHLNNLPEKKLMEIFPILKIQKNSSVIEQIPVKNITNYIEKSLLSSKMLTLRDLVSINFIVFYGMTLDQNNLDSLSDFGIITIFKNIKYCQRKYLLLLLDLYLKLYNKKKSLELINNANELMNYILANNILPNEEMMDVLEKYTQVKSELRMDKELSSDAENKPKRVGSCDESNLDKDEMLVFDKINFKNFKTRKMFLKKNNCRDGILKEDTIMKYADNTIYDGDLKISCSKCNNDIKPVLFFQDRKDVIETQIYSALKVLNTLFELYKNKYYAKMTYKEFSNDDLKNLAIIALNLLFYLNNTQIIVNPEEKNLFEYFLIFYLKKYNQKTKNK